MANEIYNGKPYRELMSYKRAKTIYLATYTFAERFLEKSDRTYDQMIQAARSGKQNIVEGAKASAGSKESELFLTNVASASLEELLEDYLDFLETRKLEIWDKESEKVRYVRNLCRRDNGSYEHYREFIESNLGRGCCKYSDYFDTSGKLSFGASNKRVGEEVTCRGWSERADN